MTLMAIKDGVFRAYAQSDNRGRRKRRGDFLPVGAAHSEFATARTVVKRDEAGTALVPSGSGATEPDALSELRVQYEEDGCGTMTLLVSGTLDLSTVLPFRDAVFTAIGNKPRLLIVDVTRLGDVDVAGISALVTAGRVARLMKVPFSVSPSPALNSILEETGIRLTVSATEPLY